VAFKNYDDKRTLYAGPTKRKEVESWITVQSLPLMGVWSEATYKRYEKRGLPIAKAFFKLDFSPENEKHTQYFKSRIEKAAVQYRDRVLTALMNMTSSDFASVVEEMGWKGKDFGLYIQSGKAKYKFDKKFTGENVVKFFGDYLDGKIEQHIKSEAVPVFNDGPVKTLVGKNFNDVVNREDKDTLIEFYAPWCGHCKQLEPKWKKLGEKLKESDSVTIAKIDATANDYPPEYDVSGFPTIYFRPAGKNTKPVLYEGAREVTDLHNFIKKNAKIPIGGKGRKKGSKD